MARYNQDGPERVVFSSCVAGFSQILIAASEASFFFGVNFTDSAKADHHRLSKIKGNIHGSNVLELTLRNPVNLWLCFVGRHKCNGWVLQASLECLDLLR